MDYGKAIIDYGKLAEQYGSFLVAIGGVSITVLTLVLAMWHLGPISTQSDWDANNRATLIKALIVATFSSFVGAHLMAETAAFVAAHKPGAGDGARQFLLAGVNIFIAVTVVMFAVMLLATEYKKANQQLFGIRRMSAVVFWAVVGCVLWWMVVSIISRMPPPQRGLLLVPIAIISFVVGRYAGKGNQTYARGWKKNKAERGRQRKKNKNAMAGLRYEYKVQMQRLRKANKDAKELRLKTNRDAMERLLGYTFRSILVFTPLSLVFCSLALAYPSDAKVSFGEALFFVSTITFPAVSLLCVSFLMWPSHRAFQKRRVFKRWKRIAQKT